jgi:hypothetical protein
MNTGEPTRNVKESEARRIERTYESSDVPVGSQISHSTRSQGKPDTGGRAEGSQVSSTNDFPRTRKLSPVNLRGGGRNGKDRNPLSREPYAVKAARTVPTGGLKKRAGIDRALTLPT